MRLIAALLMMFIIGPAQAQVGQIPGWPPIHNIATGGGDTAEAIAFIARTSPTITGATATNYKTLINTLVNTNSTISGTLYSRLDLLLIFAAPDSANALLNLPSGTYAASLSGSPTFTPNTGFTGNASAGITSNFHASTAVSPQFTRNSGHMATWIIDIGAIAATSADDALGGSTIYPNYTGTDAYARINDATSGPGTVVNSRGFLLGNRDGASSHQIYKDGASISSDSTASSAVTAGAFEPLTFSSTRQTAAFTSGAALSATDVFNLYTALRTFMTAAGVP